MCGLVPVVGLCPTMPYDDTMRLHMTQMVGKAHNLCLLHKRTHVGVLFVIETETLYIENRSTWVVSYLGLQIIMAKQLNHREPYINHHQSVGKLKAMREPSPMA